MAEVPVKELQSLLQSTLGEQLTLITYTVQDLLPPGENYGSHIVDIHTVIKINKDSDNESLFLVGKLPPNTQAQRDMFDSSFTFRKEIFMYSKILPFYQQLQIDSGIKEEETFNIGPKFYGSRMSLNADDEFDDDAAILLENLKPKGYYCIDRKIGSDLTHAKCTIKALAHFHVLGMATKEKNPQFFETIKKKSPCLILNDQDAFMSVFEQKLKDIIADPETKDYFSDSVDFFNKSSIESWIATPTEPWSSVIHGDFWSNNIMYHRKDNNSEPDDVKFVDYQNFMFVSPIRELIFFITCGLDHDAISHVDELIDLYYDTIIDRLTLLNCNITPYTRKSFNEKLREDARIEFPHGFSHMKIMTMDVAADDPNSKNVMGLMGTSTDNTYYKRKLKDFLETYSEKGWL